ncbi:MAG: YiiX family permuted papain-like enzyme [bacterium]|nr:YiiX family permuted papain-like enzyme [bacterium]
MSAQGEAVRQATGSKYSHMGIVFSSSGKHLVYEAVQPVKATPLETWIRRGKKGHYVVKRLKDASRILTPDVVAKMKTVCNTYIGKNYDIYFQWSDKRIYCSELVWKIYKAAAGIKIGCLRELGTFDLTGGAVKQKLKERFGNRIPLKEPVISPAAMFESPLLETICRGDL